MFVCILSVYLYGCAAVEWLINMKFISDIDIDKAKENFKKIGIHDVYDWIDRSNKHGEIYGYIYKNKIIIVVNPTISKKNVLKIEKKYCFSGNLTKQNDSTVLEGDIRPVYVTYILIFLLMQMVSMNNYLNQSISENVFMFFCICIIVGILYIGNRRLIKNLWCYATIESLYELIEECLAIKDV